MKFVMSKVVLPLFLRQPVIAYGVSTLLAAAASRGLPIDTAVIKDGITGLVVALGGVLLHGTVIAPATNLAQNEESARQALTRAGSSMVGKVGDLTADAELIATNVATEVAANAGGFAGQLVQEAPRGLLRKVFRRG